MPDYRVISSDNHVFEPPDLWTSRVKGKYSDRVPRIVREANGGDFWWSDNGSVRQSLSPGAQTGVRFEDVDQLTNIHTWDEVRTGGYIPEDHIKDMDADGVDVSIVYPTVGLIVFGVPDSDLLSTICNTYNDWLAEFCNAYPRRLKGIAMVNVDDVSEGVKELERCANKGLAGGMIAVAALEGKRYNHPDYEPIWAAAQDLEMPLGLHLATNRPGPLSEYGRGRESGGLSAAFLANCDHWIRMSLGDMIFSGVFERHPNLYVGAVEHELSWVPHFLDRIDYTYTQRVQNPNWHKFNEDMLPSDYFHRNVFVGFQEDALGIRLRDIIGVNNIMWGSDYPHTESTFPRSQQILEEVLADCTLEERAKIAGGNAARVYKV